MDELFRREDGTVAEVLLDNPFLKPGFSIGETDWFREFAGYRMFFGPLGLRSLVGSYFFIDGKLAGWAGVYRTTEQASFSRRDLERLQPYEARLLALFTATCPRDRWQLPAAGAVAVLNERGNVVQACADAPEWLAQGRICAELRAQAKAFATSGEHARELFVRRLAVRLTRLVGPDGPSVYVHLTPTAGQPVPALAQLSRRQRAVATALIEGATIAEAARALGMSPETVRSHLKAIYAHFGVSTRVELMKALRE
jgi:DNA-binding CsgD family transcriptional regulator